MSIHIQTTCPHCQHILNVRSEYLGKKVRCKFCGRSFVVQEDAEVPAPPDHAGDVESSREGQFVNGGQDEVARHLEPAPAELVSSGPAPAQRERIVPQEDETWSLPP